MSTSSRHEAKCAAAPTRRPEAWCRAGAGGWWIGVRAPGRRTVGGGARGELGQARHEQRLKLLEQRRLLVKEVLRGSAFASVILRLAHQDSLLGVGRADVVQRESVPGGRVGSAASPSVLIPQGSAVVMSPTVLGQDPDNWSNPAAFDPHRFLAPVADASSAASQPQPDAAAYTSDIRSEVLAGTLEIITKPSTLNHKP